MDAMEKCRNARKFKGKTDHGDDKRSWLSGLCLPVSETDDTCTITPGHFVCFSCLPGIRFTVVFSGYNVLKEFPTCHPVKKLKRNQLQLWTSHVLQWLLSICQVLCKGPHTCFKANSLEGCNIVRVWKGIHAWFCYELSCA